MFFYESIEKTQQLKIIFFTYEFNEHVVFIFENHFSLLYVYKQRTIYVHQRTFYI